MSEQINPFCLIKAVSVKAFIHAIKTEWPGIMNPMLISVKNDKRYVEFIFSMPAYRNGFQQNDIVIKCQIRKIKRDILACNMTVPLFLESELCLPWYYIAWPSPNQKLYYKIDEVDQTVIAIIEHLLEHVTGPTYKNDKWYFAGQTYIRDKGELQWRKEQ